jgi:hypothetical protein
MAPVKNRFLIVSGLTLVVGFYAVFGFIYIDDHRDTLPEVLAGAFMYSLLPIYFVPSIIAWKRKHWGKYVITLGNVIGGWTFAWIILLWYACGTTNKPPKKPVSKKVVILAIVLVTALGLFIFLGYLAGLSLEHESKAGKLSNAPYTNGD